MEIPPTEIKIYRYVTDIITKDNSYWSDNGLEMRKRYFEGKKKEASYFPMQSTTFIKGHVTSNSNSEEDTHQFTVCIYFCFFFYFFFYFFCLF